MPLTRREFLKASGVLTAAGFVGGCVPQPEAPLPSSATADKITESDSSEIQPLWSEGGYREQAFNIIYQELQSGEYVARSNLEAGRFIFLRDPNKKPFYDTLSGIEPPYGEVVTLYQEFQDQHLLWPLAQDYRTLGFMNVFLIGAYGDFPQEARTLKVGARGQISAEANVIGVLADGNNEFAGIEIVEVHYEADGSPIFRCTSQFNQDMVKVGETNILGEKIEEYYFLWPTRES